MHFERAGSRSQLSRWEILLAIKLLAWSRAPGCPNPGGPTRDSSEELLFPPLQIPIASPVSPPLPSGSLCLRLMRATRPVLLIV